MSLYKIKSEIATVLLPPSMSLTNNGDTNNEKDFNYLIQLNDSPNNNPIPFTTGV